MKKLIVFDLDGTLAESKMAIDEEMAGLLTELLKLTNAAVTGGGSLDQFQKQLLGKMNSDANLYNLFLFPTSGSSFFRFIDGKWEQVYSYSLTDKEKKVIFDAFEKTLKDIDYTPPEKTYGPVIEDRGSQITFSAIGQEAPIEEKLRWNKDNDWRLEIKKGLDKYLSDFDVGVAGLTSVDVIKKGVDKSLAINEAMKILNISKEEAVFVGDALFPGGNDYAATKAGVETIRVSGPEETKKIIQRWL